jgi:hypothetical protein
MPGGSLMEWTETETETTARCPGCGATVTFRQVGPEVEQGPDMAHTDGCPTLLRIQLAMVRKAMGLPSDEEMEGLWN